MWIVSACAAILALIISILTGGSPTAATPATGAPPAAQSSSADRRQLGGRVVALGTRR